MKPILPAVGLLLAMLCQAAPSPQSGVTPGTVALLVARNDPEAKSQLRQALLHADPGVRTLAARVIAMAHPDLGNELFGALAREREEIVAAEQLRDLLDVAGPGALAAVETQVRRIDRPAARAYAE